MTTKLTHPESKQTVETNNPEAYISQGWVEKVAKKAESDSESPAK